MPCCGRRRLPTEKAQANVPRNVHSIEYDRSPAETRNNTLNLEISSEQRDLLVAVVDSRVSELHPEIRRCMDHSYKEALKRELEHYRTLLEQLRSLENPGG
jgi:hypothetical protein